MLIYDQRNFDLHLTQLNCAIANDYTYHMLLAFATGRPLILIPVYSFKVSLLILTMSLSEIKAKMYKLPIIVGLGVWCLTPLDRMVVEFTTNCEQPITTKVVSSNPVDGEV
jgi:hypothetical protein